MAKLSIKINAEILVLLNIFTVCATIALLVFYNHFNREIYSPHCFGEEQGKGTIPLEALKKEAVIKDDRGYTFKRIKVGDKDEVPIKFYFDSDRISPPLYNDFNLDKYKDSITDYLHIKETINNNFKGSYQLCIKEIYDPSLPSEVT